MISEMSVNLKSMLVEELSSIAKAMKEEPDLSKKMFLFSATYGMVDRVMRLAYDRELLMVSLILNHAYNSFLARLTSFAQGDRAVPLTNKAFNRLADLMDELAVKMKNGEATSHVLEELNELSFLTTGAGHYMKLTGKLAKE